MAERYHFPDTPSTAATPAAAVTDADTPAGTTTPTSKPSARVRTINSCLTCRRRKVKCDQAHPTCGSCRRGAHDCVYAKPDAASHATASGRIIKRPQAEDVYSRLERLEALLEQTMNGGSGGGRVAGTGSGSGKTTHTTTTAATATAQDETLDAPVGDGITSDDRNGTLLLEDGGGSSHFVSSLHWALLADELHDIKAMVVEQTESEMDGGAVSHPSSPDAVASPLLPSSYLLSSPRGSALPDLTPLLPADPADVDFLFHTYTTHIDPMTRIIHKPTLARQLPGHVASAHPLAFALCHAATYALPPHAVLTRFGQEKEDLLARYRRGLEAALLRDSFLTTSSLDVLQAFVMYLTVLTREDSVGRAWALVGLAHRVAVAMGLHRDPGLFAARARRRRQQQQQQQRRPPRHRGEAEGEMDEVTVEVRRRIWHQVCHMDTRAAEAKGQEVLIGEESFTTRLPRNVSDADLIEGRGAGWFEDADARARWEREHGGLSMSEQGDVRGWTDMSLQLVRFDGYARFRRIIQRTYAFERWVGERGEGLDMDVEGRRLLEDVERLVGEGEAVREIVRRCDLRDQMQRFTVGLAQLVERRCWVLAWLRVPPRWKGVVFGQEGMRRLIFLRSVQVLDSIIQAAREPFIQAFFSWHLNSHASFQSLMHVISELRHNRSLGKEELGLAYSVLQAYREVKRGGGSDGSSRLWAAIRGIIDRTLRHMPRDQDIRRFREKFLVGESWPAETARFGDWLDGLRDDDDPPDPPDPRSPPAAAAMGGSELGRRLRTGEALSDLPSPWVGGASGGLEVGFDHREQEMVVVGGCDGQTITTISFPSATPDPATPFVSAATIAASMHNDVLMAFDSYSMYGNGDGFHDGAGGAGGAAEFTPGPTGMDDALLPPSSFQEEIMQQPFDWSFWNIDPAEFTL